MNKTIFQKKYGQKITDIQIIDDEKLIIVLEQGQLEIRGDHDQDCCEHVYSDFSGMKYHKEELVDKFLDELIIKGIEEMGFLMCLAGTKIFVPCYNTQNGYYSSRLSLEIKEGETTTTIDISEFKEDNIN